MRHWVPVLRQDLGLTMEAMGRELGVSRGRINQLEKQGGSLRGERVAAVWTKHGRRLRRLGFSLNDVMNPPREVA